MENLPGDVLSDIFIHLLAKQLAQMRCFCKFWNALLSESSFVKSHLHHSIHNNDEILLFFPWALIFDSNYITARLTQSPGLELINFVKVPVNLQPKYIYGRVVGSVNGLICLHYQSYNHDDVIYIWNPSLSAILTLPPCSLPSAKGNHFRFGFDSITDDYKVVKVNMIPEVEVYSIRKGYWESIFQRIQSHIRVIRVSDKVCVDGHDGHLHWLGSAGLKCKQQTIVAFDLCAEIFSEMPLPDSILHHHGYCYNALRILGGKLCVMWSRVRCGKCEVWVMDEYGVPESWVKHHAFSEFSSRIIPYGFTSHIEFVFEVDGRVCMYDPVAAQTKTFSMDSIGPSKNVEYADSLVWVAPLKHELSKGHL